MVCLLDDARSCPDNNSNYHKRHKLSNLTNFTPFGSCVGPGKQGLTHRYGHVLFSGLLTGLALSGSLGSPYSFSHRQVKKLQKLTLPNSHKEPSHAKNETLRSDKGKSSDQLLLSESLWPGSGTGNRKEKKIIKLQ